MRIKHNETGRSMVEMLGVLAIMGVLSIGGVAGYRYAVDKMNANEIINELKKRAITASQQRVLGQGINLSEYGVDAKIKGTYTVTPTDNYNENPSQFALEVAGVPERVCEMIIDSDWALPTAMSVNGGSCVEGANGNTMTFAFNNALGSGDAGNGETPDVTTEATTEVTATETVSPEVSDDQMCESLKGFGRDGEESRVCASCGDIRTLDENGSCWLTTCPDGYMHDFASFGTCIPCSQMDNATNSDFEDGGTMTQMFISECQACGGTFQPEDGRPRGGYCHSNSVAMSTVTESTELDETEVSETDEIWTDLEISDSISEPEESVSEEQGTCRSGQFMNLDGNCKSCSESRPQSSIEDECNKCDDTSTPRIMSSLGACALPCESGKVMLANGDCVSLCSSGQFMNEYGTCHSCSDSYSVSNVTAEECAKCDDTTTPRTMYGNYCGLKSCPSGKVLSANGDCVSPCSSGQFMSNSGSCFSCSDDYSRSATAEECAKCDGTSTPRVMSTNGYCVLPCESGEVLSASGRCVSPCSSGKFMDEYGYCYSCSTSYAESTSAAECAKCDGTSTPRVMYNGRCGLKSCSSGNVMSADGNCVSPCGSGNFMNSYGNCYSCSNSYAVLGVTAEECAKCDNTSTPRYMSGEYCLKR